MLILLLIWCLSIGVSVLAIPDVKYLFKTENQIWVCKYIMSKTNYIYNVTVYFFVTLIPIISLITIYIRAAKALAIRGLDSNNSAVKRRNAMKKKVLKLFTVIVCTFAVLTIPYYLYSFAYTTCVYFGIIKTIMEIKICTKILNIMVLVITSNCCVNPLIYCKMHKDISRWVVNIQRRCLNTFCCLCRKNSTE